MNLEYDIQQKVASAVSKNIDIDALAKKIAPKIEAAIVNSVTVKKSLSLDFFIEDIMNRPDVQKAVANLIVDRINK